MRILLDTQIFLWYIAGDKRLPPQTVRSLWSFHNELFLSSVSVWEIIQKHQIGKLPLPQPPEVFLPAQRQLHGIQSLDFDEASALRLSHLPLLHKDPFDRMLICQTVEHSLVLATVDAEIRRYAITIL